MNTKKMAEHTDLLPYKRYIDYIYLFAGNSVLAEFARNVEKQGFCSEKQHIALQGMCKRLADRRLQYQARRAKPTYSYNKRRSRHKDFDYGEDYTYDEEMQGGCWGEF